MSYLEKDKEQKRYAFTNSFDTSHLNSRILIFLSSDPHIIFR